MIKGTGNGDLRGLSQGCMGENDGKGREGQGREGFVQFVREAYGMCVK